MNTQADFFAAVNQIAAERNIDPESIFEAIRQAMLTVYKKYYGEGESIFVEINNQTGEIRMIADKKVVDKVTDEKTQIALKTAKAIEPRLKKGDHIEVDVTPAEGFGRLAAQVAKQVIFQKVREAEKDVLVRRFSEKLGTIQTGTIQRMDGRNVIVEIDKITVTMPPEEQIAGEFYKSATRKKFFLKETKETAQGHQLVVSRGCAEFLLGLFELEVPEISTGTVVIKSVARESGSRSKVAVWSTQEGVDPIGSCVGQRGVRINAVTDELGGEKIDIILWDDDMATYIANALSPAEVIDVTINEKEKTAKVRVPEDQLSLAIGKEGQNVRLAAKLTGWKIDITGPSGEILGSADSKVEKEESEEEISSEGKRALKKTKKDAISARTEKALKIAKLTLDDLKKMSEEEISKIKGIGPKALKEILEAIK